jgi:hypothetical protein
MTKGKKIGIGLDKMVIGLPYPKLITNAGGDPTAEELNLHDAQKKQFASQMKHIESVIQTGKYHCNNVKGTNLNRYKVLSDTGGELLCIFTLGFSYGSGVINFEFNPSKLNPDNFAEIDGLLCVMFFDHYDELFARGVVSHAEFFIDIYGEDLSKLALIDSGRRSTKKYKGTTYHGKRASRLVATLYDKDKQAHWGEQVVRIEVRINRRDISFRDLVEQDIFNPLRSLLAVELAQMQSASQKWNMPDLGDSIIALGMYGAIANTPARKAIWAHLKEHAAPWWQPEIFWSAHRKLLMKLKPGHAGVFA